MQGVIIEIKREPKTIKAEEGGLEVVLVKLMQKGKICNLHQNILKINSSDCQE